MLNSNSVIHTLKKVVPLCSSSMAVMHECINHTVQLLILFASFALHLVSWKAKDFQ